MSKKIIALFLVACTVFCLFACGTPEETTPTTVATHGETASIAQTEASTDGELQTVAQQKETEAVIDAEPEAAVPTQAQGNTPEPTKAHANQTSHAHRYSSATCTLPKKCACGKTAGTALGHSYSSATCTSPKICTRCGATSGSALGHSYASATCTSPKECTRCGKTSGSALGHNYSNNKCTRCGKTDPDSAPVKLVSLPVIDDSVSAGAIDYPIKSTYGDTYYDAVVFGTHSSYVIFNLRSQYTKFTGGIVLRDSVPSDCVSSVNIYVDNVKKYSVGNITKTTDIINFSVDVSGGSTLKIEVFSDSSWEPNEKCYIVNGLLRK